MALFLGSFFPMRGGLFQSQHFIRGIFLVNISFFLPILPYKYYVALSHILNFCVSGIGRTLHVFLFQFMISEHTKEAKDNMMSYLTSVLITTIANYKHIPHWFVSSRFNSSKTVTLRDFSLRIFPPVSVINSNYFCLEQHLQRRWVLKTSV